MPETQPTWDDSIAGLFAQPYWLAAERRADTAAEWHGCMSGYGIDLHDYASVRAWAVTIYDYLYSRMMPMTTDPTQLWPDEAVEQLRRWANQGCRQHAADPVVAREVIPSPRPRPAPLRIRKDIRELSPAELDRYRARLDAIDIGKADPRAIWQQAASIHTNWCLHYQEAFLLWHRAFLLYFEQLIDFPIPYWNLTSPDTLDPAHPDAGLPQAFKDTHYTHPDTGETRLNPLRFAVAKDGVSKAAQIAGWVWNDPGMPGDARYVQRDPGLYTNDPQKLAMLGLYQKQIVNALLWPTFSAPEGAPGYPWANIPTFNPPPPESDYPHRCDFDGLFEQPHDNVHGWAGPDMADNAYTAFDPIFWAHHSNLDRIFENWKREHADATYTAPFPIRPFVGPLAREVDEADRRAFVYTTIGDMVKDSRALGYDYMPPKGRDLNRTDYQEWPEHCYIVFGGVRCTQKTYTLDLFLNQPNPQPGDAQLSNLHYIGQIMRLGMGIADDKDRCIKDGVTRVLDSSASAYALKLTSASTITIDMIVTDVTDSRILPPEEYRQLPGFAPAISWGPSITSLHAASAPAGDCGGACHM